MAEAGAVGWQFHRVASFSFPLDDHDSDQIFELAVESGADDVNFDNGEVEIVGPVDSFKSISVGLNQAGIHPEEAGLRMIPTNEIELESDDDTIQVLKLVEALEEMDDIHNVFHNMRVPDSVWTKLEEA